MNLFYISLCILSVCIQYKLLIVFFWDITVNFQFSDVSLCAKLSSNVLWIFIPLDYQEIPYRIPLSVDFHIKFKKRRIVWLHWHLKFYLFLYFNMSLTWIFLINFSLIFLEDDQTVRQTDGQQSDPIRAEPSFSLKYGTLKRKIDVLRLLWLKYCV